MHCVDDRTGLTYRTLLGELRGVRDIRRKTAGHDELREAFVRPLYLAECVLWRHRRQRGRKVYSLHAPEVECIGKGKSHRLAARYRSEPVSCYFVCSMPRDGHERLLAKLRDWLEAHESSVWTRQQTLWPDQSA